MSATTNILSHKMARRQRRRTRKHRQPRSRLELLPVELQLAILENMSTCEDLVSLVASSRTIRAVYDRYKKEILAYVVQATLGDTFIEACMLQRWRSTIDAYRESEPWEDNLNDPESFCLDRLNRHIQLKFLHDWYEHATASVEEQIRIMKNLLTVEDFEQIMTFYGTTVKPLSRLFIEEPAPVHDFESLDAVPEPDPTPLEPWFITVTEWQRIMRTLYRFEICCRLYGPEPELRRLEYIWMGNNHGKVLESDFFGMFDASEIEELSFVYVKLAFELHKAVHPIRGNWKWAEVQGSRAHPTSARSPWRFTYDNWVVPGFGLGGWIAGTLSMGLGLLNTVRSAGTADEVAAIMIAENPPALEGFMWDTIIWLREAWHFSGGGEWAFPDSWCDRFWE